MEYGRLTQFVLDQADGKVENIFIFDFFINI